MEAITNDISSDFEFLGLNAKYNPVTNSFEDGHLPVREVTERHIPAFCPETQSISETEFDTFSGIIDAVTGEPLHGTRIYVRTGEIYEGKFHEGRRHGDSAIVNNICIPKINPQLPHDSSDLGGAQSQFTNLSFNRANFFGRYDNDEPVYGTLVTDTFSYRGAFQKSKFCDLNGELVHSSGYKYKGEFQEGLFHGMGREVLPRIGEYQGEFRNGVRHGMGTFKEYLPSDNDYFEMPDKESMKDIQKKVYDLFSNGENDQSTEQDIKREDSHPRQYTYSGLYHCNMRHGEGTEWIPDGEMFTGQFLADRRHGHGILKTKNDTYEGQWRAGFPLDGNCWRVIYSNGDSYQGHIVNMEPHGYGIYTEANGNIYSGDWRKGQRHGNGIISKRQGTEFSGEWKDDVQVSKKRLEETDGTLSAIAEALRLSDDSSMLGEETSEGHDMLKHEVQLSFLQRAMSKSIETSLHLLAQHQPEDETDHKCIQPEQGQTSPKPRDDHRATLHNYVNGDTYLGALDPENQQRTGYGVYVSKCTESTYTGQFRKNLRHGYGILINSQLGKYAGDFVNDKKHGIGTLILSDASSYHGGFANGCFDGKGTLCERNGAVYVGDWKAGLRDGEGMETTPDGSVYKGHFKHGRREGNGTLLEKNGGKIIYNGEWRDGKYNGEGILVKRVQLTTGRLVQMKFEGTFKDDKQHGYGVLSCGETVCKGVWSHDFPVSGKWRVSYKDGSVYCGQALAVEEGAIRDNPVVVIPDGFGTMKYPSNDLYAGNFEYGIRCGEGTCVFATGEKWEGTWKNDRIDKNGHGTLTMCNGKVHQFSENSMQGVLSRNDKLLQLLIDQASKRMQVALGHSNQFDR